MKPLYQRSEIRIAPDPRGTESSVNTSRLMGINACENLEEVQVLLGHASVQTTERYVGLNSKFVMP